MSLTPAEQALLASIDSVPMLAQVLEWAAVNSGTGNMAGLARMARLLARAFAALPGEVTLIDPAPVEAVGADGTMHTVPAGQHLVLRVRPDASARVLLTGHMDTVFGADDPFQTCRWLDDATLNGPGTADMKAGLAVMLAGLMAFETMQPTLGYDVLINADEETGSLASAALIRELAAGKIAALTYEPALPDGAMAGARPGSGNYVAVVRGRMLGAIRTMGATRWLPRPIWRCVWRARCGRVSVSTPRGSMVAARPMWCPTWRFCASICAPPRRPMPPLARNWSAMPSPRWRPRMRFPSTCTAPSTARPR